jgi:hypothetical protein
MMLAVLGRPSTSHQCANHIDRDTEHKPFIASAGATPGASGVLLDSAASMIVGFRFQIHRQAKTPQYARRNLHQLQGSVLFIKGLIAAVWLPRASKHQIDAY